MEVGTRIITLVPSGPFPAGTKGVITERSDVAFDYELTVQLKGTSGPGERRFFKPDELRSLANKRLTISGANVTVVSNAPDEVVVEVESFAYLGFEDFEPISYVQVDTAGYSHLTYIDPTGALKVGDRVLVPLSYRSSEATGVVKALGRKSGYTGPCKTVSAKLLVEELSA